MQELRVSNLPASATEKDLRRTFDLFGEVAEVHIDRRASARRTRCPGPTAVVRMARAADAAAAINSVDGLRLAGQRLEIEGQKA